VADPHRKLQARSDQSIPYSYRYSNSNSDRDSNGNGYSHSNGDANRDTNSHANSYSDCNPDAYPGPKLHIVCQSILWFGAQTRWDGQLHCYDCSHERLQLVRNSERNRSAFGRDSLV
jgi:hypothetical protein